MRSTPTTSPRHGPRRSRVPFEAGRLNIHSLSAYAIDDVKISPGKDRAARVEIEMSNSAGIYQVDELLATKLRGSGLEEHIEVIARIDAEHEQRLMTVFRIQIRVPGYPPDPLPWPEPPPESWLPPDVGVLTTPVVVASPGPPGEPLPGPPPWCPP
jgi:hypothetical protein